jgi:hypothetical protein
MATLRGSSSSYNVGNTPPRVTWTIVRGDTAAFKVYVTDDERAPLNLDDWSIEMQIKRPTNPTNIGTITSETMITATLILTLTPEQDVDDADGEFTVSLTALQSEILQTGDLFDIELSTAQRSTVWTVAQGSVLVLEDVTDPVLS